MNLYSYRMTYDTGFAPNPFHGILTLATCKPGIRKTKRNRKNGGSDWVAGFASKALVEHPKTICNLNSDALIWIGMVDEFIPYEDYFTRPEYEKKKHDPKGSDILKVGDNIYRPNPGNPSGFDQMPGSMHGNDDIEHDLSGEGVLIFKDFWYFGRKASKLPIDAQIRIPVGSTPYGYKTTFDDEQVLRDLIAKHSGGRKRLLGMPCMMDSQSNELAQKKSCGAFR